MVILAAMCMAIYLMSLPDLSPYDTELSNPDPLARPPLAKAYDGQSGPDSADFAQIRRSRLKTARELRAEPFQQIKWLHGGMRPPVEALEGNGRTLVIFAFERTPKNSLDNVEFFLRQVVGGSRAEKMKLDFIFVDTSEEGPTFCFPELPNLLYLHRPKVGFDLCSYKTALAMVPAGLYKYVVFMNGSVKGPFSREEDFLKLFKEQLSALTPMVGTTVNCQPRVHLQSMFLMVNSIGVEVVNATLNCNITKKFGKGWQPEGAVFGQHGEVNISQNVLKQNLNIGALQLMWRGLNLTNRQAPAVKNACSLRGTDPYFPNLDVDPITKQGKDIDPEEVRVCFFASKRHLSRQTVKELFGWRFWHFSFYQCFQWYGVFGVFF